ncbi:MAG: GntR family transcriptional regulator [Acidobacteriota bacterium]|nr:GntR family transcriptional regulator [Acidobacteriota bacterium]
MLTDSSQPPRVLEDPQAGTLAEQAYVRLLEEIVQGELPPGTLVREEDLAERFGFGRTPIREALQRLKYEGYLTILPRRGTLVSDVSITDLAAIYEIRVRLESWAARLAAERATEPDRAQAQQLVADLGELDVSSDYDALLATDRRIHRFVYRCSKNPYLASNLDHYHNLSLRILYMTLRRYPALTPMLDEVVHDQRAILDAICRGDADTAERVATDHIRRFEQQIRQVI